MADIMSDALSMVGGPGLLILVGACVFIFWAVYNMFNQRFPKKKFLAIDGVLFRYIIQRIDGDKIVEDNLINLVMGRRTIGENINDFVRIRMQTGRGFEECYLCQPIGKALMPVRYNPNLMLFEPTEIKNGRDIAMRYIAAEEAVEQQAKTQEPLAVALMTAIPVTLVIVAFSVSMYLAYLGISDNQAKVAVLTQNTAQLIADNANHIEKLINITRGTP